MSDLALMARKLALRYVRDMADANYDEHDIMATQGHQSCGQSFVDNTGGDEFGAYSVSIGGYYNLDNKTGLMRNKVPYSKVFVSRILNQEVHMVFSLHELYQECKKGQLALL